MYKLEDKKISYYGDVDFSLLQLLGVGSGADVYKLRIGNEFYALKVFNGLRKENLSNYVRKMNISLESFVSPKKLLYINGKFSGYIMDFCRGKDLSKRKLNISIDDFATYSSKLMKDTDKLSLMRYTIFDTFLSNVMFDNGFKMIDMDDYPYISDKSVTFSEILRTNKENLNRTLINIFLSSTGLAQKFNDDVYLTKLMSKCNSNKISFEELFNEVCLMAYNNAEEELVNISDIGKSLKKKRKI